MPSGNRDNSMMIKNLHAETKATSQLQPVVKVQDAIKRSSFTKDRPVQPSKTEEVAKKPASPEKERNPNELDVSGITKELQEMIKVV